MIFLIKPFILDNYRFTCSCRNDIEGAHVPSAQFPPLVSLSKLWDKTTTQTLPPMLATHSVSIVTRIPYDPCVTHLTLGGFSFLQCYLVFFLPSLIFPGPHFF